MNIEKIAVNGYYVWVDKDAEIKEGDRFYSIRNLVEKAIIKYPIGEHIGKIIAASPELNLEGLHSYIEWLAEQEYIDAPQFNSEIRKLAFIKGYQTAEKELFIEEDVRKAIDMARSGTMQEQSNGYGRPTEARFVLNNISPEEIINQLKQEKYD